METQEPSSFEAERSSSILKPGGTVTLSAGVAFGAGVSCAPTNETAKKSKGRNRRSFMGKGRRRSEFDTAVKPKPARPDSLNHRDTENTEKEKFGGGGSHRRKQRKQRSGPRPLPLHLRSLPSLLFKILNSPPALCALCAL